MANGVSYQNSDGITETYVSTAKPLPVTLTTGTTNQNVNITQVNGAAVNTGPSGDLRVAPQVPTAANLLVGYQTFTSTTSATTLITVPAGKTWVGTIAASCACQEVAAGTAAPQARAVFTTAGTNVTPAAGTYFAVEAKGGANAATGLVGSQDSTFGSLPFIVVAPAGNSVTIAVASTNAGTASVVDASASGVLQ